MPELVPTPSSVAALRATCTVSAADIQAHIAKVKAAWREHERAMTWEEKIAVIEKMRERTAQLERARNRKL